MVDTQLTPDLIQEGVTLVEGLDEAGVSTFPTLLLGGLFWERSKSDQRGRGRRIEWCRKL